MSKKVKVLLCMILLVAAGVASTIIYFNNHYLPGSNFTISETETNIDIGLKNRDDAAEIILSKINDIEYTLTLYNDDELTIKLVDVADIKDKEEIVYLLNQNSLSVFDVNNTSFNISLNDIVTMNSSRIENLVHEIDDKNIEKIESVSAYITYSEDTKQYDIVEDVRGNILSDDASKKLQTAFENFEFQIDLSEIGFYDMPDILSDNTKLREELNLYNEYKDTVITYNFGGNTEVIDISVFGPWLKENLNEDGSMNSEIPFYIDDEMLSKYVSELNSKYTTLGTSRTIKTSTGETVTLSTGDYGWWLDVEAMKEDIKNHILNKLSEEKDAIYKQTAVKYGDLDFKDSYVEVSIANQKLWMYVNGECIVETDVVTGDISDGNGTRKGVFSLTYKTRDAVLRGPGYASPVSYWMPFDGGIGLHDATWRSSFGGTIYKNNGSHGCVNMPFNAAKTVYENLDKTMPIIVW